MHHSNGHPRAHTNELGCAAGMHAEGLSVKSGVVVALWHGQHLSEGYTSCTSLRLGVFGGECHAAGLGQARSRPDLLAIAQNSDWCW